MSAIIALTSAGIIAGFAVYGILSRRNIAFFLLSIELLFNAGILSMIGLMSLGYIGKEAILAAVFFIAVGAAELAVGFAIAIALRRKFGISDITQISSLRGSNK